VYWIERVYNQEQQQQAIAKEITDLSRILLSVGFFVKVFSKIFFILRKRTCW
jgi:uncharacterized protein (UPF0335 family)